MGVYRRMASDLETIRARRIEIVAEKKRLDAEDSELEIAERVLVRMSASKPMDTSGGSVGCGTQGSLLALSLSGGGEITETRKVLAPTHEQMVRSVLANTRETWFSSSGAIGAAVLATFGVEIPKTSLRPMLSKMKRDGVIIRRGEKGFALRERALLDLPITQDAPA